MINEKDCIKILNDGDMKFSLDEAKQIRDLLIQLAVIEFEQYNAELKKSDNERNMLFPSQYRRAS
jgi:hypothetical protein